MTATITPPEWLTVGAKVAVVHGQSVRFEYVERFTKTTVVVGGRPFRLQRLSRNMGTWEGTAYIHSPDDPALEPLLYAQNRDQAVRNLEHALQAWRRDNRWNVDRQASVRDAVARLTPYLTQSATEAAR